MSFQNRVTPEGEIIATTARGMFMGNRGQLHTAEKTLTDRRWTWQGWVTCVLSFKSRHREIMAPGRYTELFFLDEAVALAAGHRPCGECRPDAYQAFRRGWEATLGNAGEPISVIDRCLHKARVNSRTREQIRHRRTIDGLPDGTFVQFEGEPEMAGAWLVHGQSLLRYTPSGYDRTEPRLKGASVVVLTPSPTVEVLDAGYRPTLHDSTIINA